MGSSSSKTVDSSSKLTEKSSGFHVVELNGKSCVIGLIALVFIILIIYVFFHKKCRQVLQNRHLDSQSMPQPYGMVTRFKNSIRRANFLPRTVPAENPDPTSIDIESGWRSKAAQDK